MQLGMIGLGRMGANIARRLMRGGHSCVVFDQSREAVAALTAEGAVGANSLGSFVTELPSPKIVWVMLPAGTVTEAMVAKLGDMLHEGDIIIDGGNSFYKDDVRRSKALRKKGVEYVDVGTSGGVWGLERGYCMMIGGPKETVAKLDPIFATLAPGLGDIPRTAGRDNTDSRPERGYMHCGPTGAGHFAKMIHNGIEYGMMQAYAEGFDILKNVAKGNVPENEGLAFNLTDLAEVWRRGSVVASWLLDLTALALAQSPTLSEFSGSVSDSGEGRWTIMAAIEEAVPADVLTAALYTRFRSRQEHTFAEQVLSAMRFGFGGHMEKH
jgi:6-phosphogluconate dehydrogenase